MRLSRTDIIEINEALKNDSVLRHRLNSMNVPTRYEAIIQLAEYTGIDDRTILENLHDVIGIQNCDCGHGEVLENIHTVELLDKSGTVDLCEMCWQDADLIEQPDSDVCNWIFASVEAQDELGW